MKNYFLLIFIFFFSIHGKGMEPNSKIKTKAAVIDFVFEDNFIYVATDGGSIEIFDFLKKKRIKEIIFPMITDFAGDEIKSKIYSIDKLAGEENLLAVVQRSDGFRDIYEYKNGKLQKIINGDKLKLMVKEARYIDSEHILMGLLSNEIIRYNIPENKIKYRKQISSYTFSDLVMHETRKMFVSADESGIVRLFNSDLGLVAYTFSGINLDNIYQLDYKKNVIITAGQDRLVGVYHFEKEKNFQYEADFLVYSVALSPEANYGAYYANEKNEIFVFNAKTHAQHTVLKGHNSVVNKILFINETMIISSAEDKELLIWKI